MLVGQGQTIGTETDPATGGAGSGTVTSVSVVAANGYSGSVATPTTTPAITITGFPLDRTANKTSAYNAVAYDLVACDISGGSFTVTLPTAPADQTVIGAKIVVPTTAATAALLSIVTGGSDVFDNAAGVTTQTMALQGEQRAWVYDAPSAIWNTVAGHLPVALLGAMRVVAKSANYTATARDVVLCTAGAGGFTVTLPAVLLGAQVLIKKVDSGAGTITITPASGTIDGAASYSLINQYAEVRVISDGTNWWVAETNSFAGTPTAPTAATSVNTTQLATTAFVHNALVTNATQPIVTVHTLQSYN